MRPRAGADDGAATAAANAVAHTLRRLLAEPAPDPAFEIDADLRPEGRQGAMVRSLSAFPEYCERWTRHARLVVDHVFDGQAAEG